MSVIVNLSINGEKLKGQSATSINLEVNFCFIRKIHYNSRLFLH